MSHATARRFTPKLEVLTKVFEAKDIELGNTFLKSQLVKVSDSFVTNDGLGGSARAHVKGTSWSGHTVNLQYNLQATYCLNEEGWKLFTCDCPRGRKVGRCKHIVGLLLLIRSDFSREKLPKYLRIFETLPPPSQQSPNKSSSQESDLYQYAADESNAAESVALERRLDALSRSHRHSTQNHSPSQNPSLMLHEAAYGSQINSLSFPATFDDIADQHAKRPAPAPQHHPPAGSRRKRSLLPSPEKPPSSRDEEANVQGNQPAAKKPKLAPEPEFAPKPTEGVDDDAAPSKPGPSPHSSPQKRFVINLNALEWTKGSGGNERSKALKFFKTIARLEGRAPGKPGKQGKQPVERDDAVVQFDSTRTAKARACKRSLPAFLGGSKPSPSKRKAPARAKTARQTSKAPEMKRKRDDGPRVPVEVVGELDDIEDPHAPVELGEEELLALAQQYATITTPVKETKTTEGAEPVAQISNAPQPTEEKASAQKPIPARKKLNRLRNNGQKVSALAKLKALGVELSSPAVKAIGEAANRPPPAPAPVELSFSTDDDSPWLPRTKNAAGTEHKPSSGGKLDISGIVTQDEGLDDGIAAVARRRPLDTDFELFSDSSDEETVRDRLKAIVSCGSERQRDSQPSQGATANHQPLPAQFQLSDGSSDEESVRESLKAIVQRRTAPQRSAPAQPLQHSAAPPASGQAPPGSEPSDEVLSQSQQQWRRKGQSVRSLRKKAIARPRTAFHAAHPIPESDSLPQKTSSLRRRARLATDTDFF